MRTDSAAPSANSYPVRARAFIAAFAAMGVAVLLQAAGEWVTGAPRGMDWFKTLAILAATLVSSTMRVPLPRLTATMSLSYVFLLLGVLDLPQADTILIAAVATLVQMFWRPRQKPDPWKIAFNLSSVVVATAFAYHVHASEVARAVTNNPFGLMVLTGMSYFCLNTMSVAAVVALSHTERLGKVWNSVYFWSFPYYVAGAVLTVVIDELQAMGAWQLALVVLPVLYVLYQGYRLYLKQLEAQRVHAEEVESLHVRTIEALAMAIEAKDECTHQHLRRVQVYAGELAKELGASEKERQAIHAASILHDIGKLAVPDFILSKPGRLTPEEFEKIKIHPVVGAEILERVAFPYPVVPIVRHHHEKWDGSGYPDGLKGEEIPLGARILAAVDCLDALASDRQYHRGLPIEEAMSKVRALSDSAFDPRVVEVLGRRVLELEKLACEPGLDPHAALPRHSDSERGEPAAGLEPSPEPSGASFLQTIAAARQEVQAIYEITQDLGNSLSLDETLSVVAARLTRLIPHHSFAIFSITERTLGTLYASGDGARLLSTLEIPVGEGLSGWVAEHRKPIVNGNPEVETAHLGDPSRVVAMKSAVSVPLDGARDFRGVLTLYHSDASAFTQDHLRILLAIKGKIALASENAASYRRAQQLASTDSLTELPNAGALFLHLAGELNRAQRSSQNVAVLICDLDGFKQINDRFGHLRGNEVLRDLAAILRCNCRPYDYVARMGGDEFVLVWPSCDLADLQRRAEGIRAAVQHASDRLLGEELLDISIGYALFPEDGSDAETLLSQADRRMYHVKDEQRHNRAIAPSHTENLATLVLAVHAEERRAHENQPAA